ncbi:MAG: sensor histidine kinase [Bacteroidales bacterium]
MKNIEDDITGKWADIINDQYLHTSSVGVAVYSAEENLLFANSAMSVFLDFGEDKLKPGYTFINPQFSTFLSGGDGLVYEGLATFGNYIDSGYVLKTKVFRRDNSILVCVEADIPDLISNNKKMSLLNQEVNNLQRELIKEKRSLQVALNQLKETQQMLIHSEKMNAMGKLVAGVAHEINNPISFVYSNLHTLQKYTKELSEVVRQYENSVNESGNQKLIEEITKIKTTGESDYLLEEIADMTEESKSGILRVKNIIEELRRFSRLDESEFKQINLIESIHSTISIIKSELAVKKIGLVFDYNDEVQLDCMPGQLNQAVLNVLINAVQAVDSGGKIEISVKDEKDVVTIKIIDNGCGIPNEIIHRVFEPFFTTKPVGSGTGLGLSIAYKIIHDLHGGDIQVESSEQGTIVKMSVPKKM